MNNLNKIVAALLLIALLPLPYFYYQLLRIVVTLAAAVNAYKIYKDNPVPRNEIGLKVSLRVLPFILIAILWNPISPVYMDKSDWMMLDIFGAVVFYFGGSDD